MHTREYRFAMIKIVISFSKVKIQDVDRIYLLHFIILISYLDMLCDSFRDAIKHALQVIELACQLYFHDNYLSVVVYCLNIHPVELIGGIFLITFTLKYLEYFYLRADKNGNKTF